MNTTTLPQISERPPGRRPSYRRPLCCVLAAAWVGAAALGWSALFRHTYQPAATGEAVSRWPEAATPAPATAEYRIVVFAHPHCPCTRATLHKFDESLTRLPRETFLRFVFATAGLSPAAVAGSSNVASARRLPGVDVRFDHSGAETRRFGATVSGEVFVFDHAGRRVFHGGVTSGRGHEGDSAAQQELEGLVRGTARTSYTAPVFGCRLPLGDLRPGDCEVFENRPLSASPAGI